MLGGEFPHSRAGRDAMAEPFDLLRRPVVPSLELLDLAPLLGLGDQPREGSPLGLGDRQGEVSAECQRIA